MKKIGTILLVLSMVLTLAGFANAGAKIKPLSVLPYVFDSTQIPLDTEMLPDETLCTIEGVSTPVIPENKEQCDDVLVGTVNEFVEGGVFTPGDHAYTASSHSFTQAQANGVNSTLATISGGTLIETLATCTREGNSDNYICPPNSHDVVYDSSGPPQTDGPCMRNGNSNVWKCKIEQGCWDGQHWCHIIAVTAKVISVSSVVLTQGTCTEKPITPAVDNYVASADTYSPGSCTDPVTRSRDIMYTDCLGQVTCSDAALDIECNTPMDIPTKAFEYKKLVTTAQVGDTISVEGNGYVYGTRKVGYRFAVFYAKPGAITSRRIYSQTMSREIVTDGTFQDTIPFTFDKSGTYTFKFWVYNWKGVVGNAVSRTVVVTEAVRD